MTPKEKANELVDKFREKTSYEYQEYAGAHYSKFEHDLDTLKQCAIVAVDELISRLSSYTEMHDQKFLEGEMLYWLDVKQELLEP